MDFRTAQSREIVAGGRVKGGMLRAHLDWVRRNHGDAALAKLLSSLPPEVSGEISSTLPASWCSFATLVALDRAIAQQFGHNVLKDLGRFSARINLDTTYRLYKRDDIHDFFKRAAALHSQFQDFGTAEYQQVSEHSGRMVHTGYACFSPTYCSSAIGYYEEALRIHNGRNVIVTETSCQCAGDSSCTFVLRWS